MTLSITLTMAAAAAFINIWLMIRIGAARRASGVWVGDGGHEFMLRRMRAQANFIENAPIVLILIAVLELANGSQFWLLVTGWAFIAARIAHGIGMDGGKLGVGRMIGAVASMAIMVGLAVMAIVTAYTMAAPATPRMV